MKFNAGDTFKIKENGITGQIISTREELVAGKHVEIWYGVSWDFLSRRAEYPASEVDDLWEKTSGLVTTLPFGAGHIQHDAKQDACCQGEHLTTYYGLKESYEYCKKCGQRKD